MINNKFTKDKTSRYLVTETGTIDVDSWNAAIEQAASIAEKYEISGPMIAYDIRGLKVK